MWRKPRVAKLGVGNRSLSDDIHGDYLLPLQETPLIGCPLFSLVSRAPNLISTS